LWAYRRSSHARREPPFTASENTVVDFKGERALDRKLREIAVRRIDDQIVVVILRDIRVGSGPSIMGSARSFAKPAKPLEETTVYGRAPNDDGSACGRRPRR
jgi:hypothetical protein